MREIKFRAWDKDDLIIINPDEIGNQSTGFESRSEWVLMQYTGLKDKNGVEIYESDILLNSANQYCEVMFGPYSNGEDFEDLDDGYGFYLKSPVLPYANGVIGLYFVEDGTLKSYSVIGNIFENPELVSKHNLG